MAVKASDIITLSTIRDVKAAYRFYKLQSSTAAAPSKPTALGTPPSGWSSVEPSYTQGSTNSLYTVDLTVFTDNTFSYSEVSLSSSYEAAKAAYNKAVNVETSLAVTAQGIEAKVAATYTTKEEFNNLEIGGRNLFYYSVLTEKNNKRNYSFGGYALTSGSFTSEGYKAVGAINASMVAAYIFGDNYTMSAGETYTFSMDIKGSIEDGKGDFGFCYTDSAGIPYYANFTPVVNVSNKIVSDTFNRVSVTFTVPEAATVSCSPALIIGGTTVYCNNVKLEKGNKPTDWTPAPEDTEGEIDALNTKYSEINQTVDGINATVGSHTAELDGLETRVTDAEAGIAMSAEEIATKVSKDGVISAINQTAETVAIDAGKINLNGAVTANEYFKINTDGSMEATAGKIGSWEISTTGIHKSYKVYVPPDDDSLKQLKEIILDGTLTKDKLYLAWYDYDNDGVLTTTDLLYCKRLVVGVVTIDYYEQTYGFIRPTFDVTVSIRTNKMDTSESDASFSIWTYAYLKEKTYRFGIDGLYAANGKFGGVNTEILAASEVSCDTLMVNGTQETFSLTNSTKVYTFSTADYPAGTVAELMITGSGGVAYALLLFSATMQLAINSSTWTAAGAIKLTQTNSRQITFSYTGSSAATFTSRIVKK